MTLKRIPVADVRIGMFVHEFCGSFLDHPFWASRVMLEDPRQVLKLRDSSIREVVIDLSRGADADTGPSGLPRAPAVARPAPSEGAAAAPAPTPTLERSFAEETARAATIRAHSRRVVSALFEHARLGGSADLDACKPLVDDIVQSVLRQPDALVCLLRFKSRDDYTYMHSVSVCVLMAALGRRLGLGDEALRDAALAGLLHDLGKAQVPLAILDKPGKLTREEFDIVKGHPLKGVDILRRMGVNRKAVLDVCLHHHERMDGKGYPHGLTGDRLSLLERMGAVCDVYDAVTSDRCYKAAWEPGDALREMATWQGHFDPTVFQAFVKTVGVYPSGTLVRLASSRLAVVLAHNPDNTLTPLVKAIYDIAAGQRVAPVVLDLAVEDDRILGRERADAWKLGDLKALWLPSAADT